MIFTSRSMVESYHDCPRLRYNNSFLLGKGLVRKSKSVPLVTGSAVHRGVEHLANRLRIGEVPDVDTAVGLAVEQYVKDVEGVGFSGKQIKTDKQQWFTFCEQKALTEALIRAWYICELPRIQERYKVLAVERDIEPIEIAPGVMWQAKCDIELLELATGDYINYSLKTCSQWTEKMEESYKNDLQGVTEIWSIEEDQRLANKHIDDAVASVKAYADKLKFAPKQLADIAAYLAKKKVDKKISGIRFCFLVKGRWMVPPIFKDDPEAVKITYSPLIRGYKFIGPNGIAYAHSWNYPNPENKSGSSKLGAGWEPFNVWEQMGIKEWIAMLPTIQKDCGDVIKQHVVTPPDVMRYEEEMREAILEIVEQEARIHQTLQYLEVPSPCAANSCLTSSPSGGLTSQQQSFGCTKESTMANVFPHNRKHCYFHFGARCEYFELCWQPEVAGDPIGSGLYEIRSPHHDSEKEYYK